MPSPTSGNSSHRGWIRQARLQSDEADRQAALAQASGDSAGAALFDAHSFPGYTLEREIHRGAQGAVYRALQKSTGRRVALKLLHDHSFGGPLERARFEREMHVLAALQHPNIVAIHDGGSHDGRLFLVMDYIDGQPLDVFMASQPRSIRETVGLFISICDAVNAAHVQGIIHRDLKPANVRINAAGRPFVLDFGLAKLTTDARGGDATVATAAAITLTGQFLGSLPWSAPEQAEGSPSRIDIRTDVYSLGVVLYQMLTGKFPYPVTGPMKQVMDGILHAAPRRPRSLRREIDDELETIVLKCLSKDRERRYQSGGQLAEDLRRYIAGQPIEAKRDSPAYVLRKSLQQHRVAATVAAGFLVVIAIGLVSSFLLWQQARRDRDRAEGEARRAETALDAEAQQRRLADEREGQTQKVSDFQGSMLRDIDMDAMGNGIVDALREQLKAALARQAIESSAEAHTPAESAGPFDLTDFNEALARANPVDVARRVMDEFVLRRAAEAAQKEFADQPLVQAQIHGSIGSSYQAMGLFAAAEPHLRWALALAEEQLGADNSRIPLALNNLGSLLRAQGKYDAAEALYRRALALRRESLVEDVELANTLNSLGLLLYEKKDLAAAEPLHREALALRRKLLGDENRHVANSLNNLAILLMDKGDLDAAEALDREALSLHEKIFGPEHRYFALSLHNLARLLEKKRDFAAAEPLYRRAVAVFRKALGDQHPDLAMALNSLAMLRKNRGDLPGAEPLVREALAICRDRLGPEHPLAATSMHNLAIILEDDRKHDEAEPLLREALRLRRRILGEHTDVAATLNQLGKCLYNKGNPAEAKPFLQEGLDMQRKLLGPGHADLAPNLTSVGVVLFTDGDYDGAESLFREAVASYRKLGQEDRMSTALNNLARVLHDKGDYAAAEPAWREGLAATERRRSAQHVDTATSMAGLAQTLVKLGRFEEAEPLMQQVERVVGSAPRPPPRLVKRLYEVYVELYEARHAAAPQDGYGRKAEMWRARLTAGDPGD